MTLIRIPIDPKHRIVIPLNVWNHMHLEPGMMIEVDIRIASDTHTSGGSEHDM